MTQVAIVGAHGKIGQLIIKHLQAQGLGAIAIVRKQEQAASLEQAGADVRLLDIESASVEQLAEALRGADAVVFSAGAGAGSTAQRKRTVDYAGSVLLANAAKRAGIQRYIQVSAIGVDKPIKPDVDPVWKAYLEAKRDADIELRNSGLDWTILRPGPLTDAPATGLIRLADDVGRDEVSREDVALTVIAALQIPMTIGKQWELSGGAIPIRDALAE